MKIIVRPRHIAEGVEDDCSRCPVALAMREAGLKRAEVGYGWVNFHHPFLGIMRLRWPWPVMEFVEAFDCGKKVQSFTFWLPI